MCIRELSSEIHHVPSLCARVCMWLTRTDRRAPWSPPRGCVVGRWVLTTQDANRVYHPTGPQLTGSWRIKMKVTSARFLPSVDVQRASSVAQPQGTVTPNRSAVTATCPEVSSPLLPRPHVPNTGKASLRVRSSPRRGRRVAIPAV